MALVFGTATIVLISLLSVIVVPHLRHTLLPVLRVRLASIRRPHEPALAHGYDPGRELRAEQRARALLRSCVNQEEWAMYSELGFLRVWGTLAERPRTRWRWRIATTLAWLPGRHAPSVTNGTQVPYAYLVYPHEPILVYIPQTGVVLGEYCVEFLDHTRPYGSARLPAADDVLAKWIALTTGERALIEKSNMHLPGRQIRIAQARRDLVRLSCWERTRVGAGNSERQAGEPLEPHGRILPRAGSVPVR
jgi:hypothetical protein